MNGRRRLVLAAGVVAAVCAGGAFAASRLQSSSAAGCAYSWGSQGRPQHPVVAFGDSITYGYLAGRDCTPDGDPGGDAVSRHIPGAGDTDYPGVASRLLGSLVLDYGLSGEQTSAGLVRLLAVLRQTHAGTVVLLEGVNDYLHGHDSAAAVASRVARMLASIRGAGARPLLLTLTPVSPAFEAAAPGTTAYVERLNGMLRRLAQRTHTRVVDLFSLFRPRGGAALLADGLHPNDQGYAVIGRAVAGALK